LVASSSGEAVQLEEVLPCEYETEDLPQFFVNPASLVIHKTKDDKTFKCGRKVSAS
jgi:hypothetical protein